jgi:hypothetical protein
MQVLPRPLQRKLWHLRGVRHLRGVCHLRGDTRVPPERQALRLRAMEISVWATCAHCYAMHVFDNTFCSEF